MRRSVFPGFPREAITFFRGLARNNRREWFQPRKEIYETQVRASMAALVEELNRELARFAPAYVTDPRKAIYRIYRDTRFSNDKTPYKTHIGAIFTRRGLDKHAGAGLYFAVSAKEVEVAGGVYMPGPDQLFAIRGHLAAHADEFRKLAKARPLRSLMGDLHGDALSRVPKGFDPNHPAAGLIRMKQWLYYVILDPHLATEPQLFPEVLKRFRVVIPLLEFLNAPLIRRQRRDPLVEPTFPPSDCW